MIFMKKTVGINDAREKQLYTLMTKLDLTYEQALETYYFDKEEVDNEEANELEKKASDKKETKAPSTIGKVKNMKAKKKVDEQRTSILSQIFGFVKGMSVVEKSQEMTTSKMTFRTEDGTYYSVAVTKHKNKPDGFKA